MMRGRSCIVKKVTEHVVRTYLKFKTLILVVAVQIAAMLACTNGALANQPQIRTIYQAPQWHRHRIASQPL